MRPDRLVVVIGTGTEVGKTWITARTATELRHRGVSVLARKPAQSFERGAPEATTDAGILASATGEEPKTVCPRHRWYPTPLAPPMAADSLGRERIRLSDLVDEVDRSWSTDRVAVGLVELAGGAFSPVAHDGDCVQLTAALRADQVILVADAGLGTISAVRPAVAALGGADSAVVMLNRFDPDLEVHQRNLAWLRDHDGFDVASSLDQLVAVVRR